MVNFGANSVSVYGIGENTALAGTSTIAAGSNPYAMAISPGGRYAYVVNGSDTVSTYSIDASTGALTGVARLLQASRRRPSQSSLPGDSPM